jgi:hypothetical protein
MRHLGKWLWEMYEAEELATAASNGRVILAPDYR